MKSFQETERGIEWYFSCLVSEMHTVIAATADDDGLPVTCAMDLMSGDSSTWQKYHVFVCNICQRTCRENKPSRIKEVDS